MKYVKEIVNTIGEIPIKIFVESIDRIQYRYNDKTSLIFVIRGEVSIKEDKNEHTLVEDDVFLINSNSLYTIDSSSTNQICIFQIDGEYFSNFYNDFGSLTFKLDPSNLEGDRAEDYKHIKKLLVRILDILVEKSNGYLLIAKQLILDMVVCLISKFTAENSEEALTLESADERTNRIIEYVLTHFKDKISLNNIAEYMHLNPQYISRYFTKQMGINLNAFISNIRLQESLKDLINSDKKITIIALEYGFPNLKSYFKAFKDNYNMTPSKYRNNYGKCNEKNALGLDFLTLNFSDDENSDGDTQRIVKNVGENYIVNCNGFEGTLDKTWKKVLSFGRAAEAMREELRNQLRLIQKDIGFEYVRFHGILSDEMMVYSEDIEGNAEYNFTYVDQLIDFLLEIKLKPFIELSYMPELLASEKKYFFEWNANVSYPKSINKWNDLIRNLVIHFLERYGAYEVENWYFQIGDGFLLSSPGKDAYFALLKSTYDAIKKRNPKLKVGGTIDHKILDDYLAFGKKEDFVMDFICFRTYSLIEEDNFDLTTFINTKRKFSEEKLILQDSIDFAYYANENFITDTIDRYIKKMNKYKHYVKEIFITEFNTSPSQKELTHDTCFKGTFFLKNILNNFDKVSSMTYWAFSDIFEETKASNYTFHGGLGFITNNGIKKPIYYVYQFMNKLGNTVIKKDNNFIVTKSENGAIQILAYNYCHFISPHQKYYSEDITLKDRYKVFDEKVKSISFTIKGIEGEVIQRIYRINKESGSAFDQWLQIGAPKFMIPDEVNYIKNKSMYGYKMSSVNVYGDFIINEKLEPHEILLIEIIPSK